MQASEHNLEGIFYEQTTVTLGTGATKKTQLLKNYCKAEQIDKDSIRVTYLDQTGKPTGIELKLGLEEFLKRFTFEPNYRPKTDKEALVDKHVARAEKHRHRKEFNSAEWEYSSALKIDQENLKANFGIGTLYMEMGEEAKAKEVFRKITEIDAIFEKENKHIFNEFGISLRKAGMYEEALEHYGKAIEISPDDEHLYFNVARVYYEKGDIPTAMEWLDKALTMNPDFDEAKRFKESIGKEGKKAS